jgi:hypothetical protein
MQRVVHRYHDHIVVSSACDDEHHDARWRHYHHNNDAWDNHRWRVGRCVHDDHAATGWFAWLQRSEQQFIDDHHDDDSSVRSARGGNG